MKRISLPSLSSTASRLSLVVAIGLVTAVVGVAVVISTSASINKVGLQPRPDGQTINDADASDGQSLVFDFDDGLPDDLESNLNLIRGNPATINSMFDDNRFADVPMDQIEINDLIVPGDAYNEVLIASPVDGLFRVKCEFSHFAYDDPIVFPDQPGVAHLHMFFGNTKANAYSDHDSLLNTGTGTCNGEDLNRTAYWAPAMLDRDGNALMPFEIMVYYKNTGFAKPEGPFPAQPYPDNLQMIAGQASSMTPQNIPTGPGSIDQVSFLCGEAYRGSYRDTIVGCSGNGARDSVEMQVAFPSCWDPAKGDYPPDGSHVAYPMGGFWQANCPATHPVRLPSVMYRIFYSLPAYGGSSDGWFLSSDVTSSGVLTPGTTSHADWFGAWHPDAIDQWVQNCTNVPQTDCELGIMSRNPDTSLVPRKEGFYKGQRIPAAELTKLCPWKEWDGQPSSVGRCL